MSKTYVTITELEFDGLLQHAKGWTKDKSGNEIVYSYTSKKNPDIMVLVYSSITNGVSRKCGADAIRICAVNTRTNKGVLKSTRVNRVAGWNERVKERVIETIEKIWYGKIESLKELEKISLYICDTNEEYTHVKKAVSNLRNVVARALEYIKSGEDTTLEAVELMNDLRDKFNIEDK
jgi:hypothetical protein